MKEMATARGGQGQGGSAILGRQTRMRRNLHAAGRGREGRKPPKHPGIQIVLHIKPQSRRPQDAARR